MKPEWQEYNINYQQFSSIAVCQMTIQLIPWIPHVKVFLGSNYEVSITIVQLVLLNDFNNYQSHWKKYYLIRYASCWFFSMTLSKLALLFLIILTFYQYQWGTCFFFENWTWTFIFLFLGTVMFMATWVCILYCLLCKMILSCDVLQIYFNEIPDEIIEKLVRIVSCNLFFFLWMFLKQTVLQSGAIFCCWVASLPLILVLCV